MSIETPTLTASEADLQSVQSPHFRQVLQLALTEDIGTGDVTSLYFIPEDLKFRAFIIARESGCVAGVEAARASFLEVDSNLDVQVMLPSGSKVAEGAHVLSVQGKAQSILTAERTALNFLQRLSGIASLTDKFVDAIQDTQTRILDTRKTTPAYRALEKAAVLAGGGFNHRMGLFDRAMVKDNHIAGIGGIPPLQQQIHKLKKERADVEIEVEADSLDQVERILRLDGVDHILLDNMSNDQMSKAVEMRGSSLSPLLEASGGITLKTVKAVAATGVDFISVGAITHSAVSLDLGLDIID